MSDQSVEEIVDLTVAQATADAAALETMVELATNGQLNRDLVEGIESHTDRDYISANVPMGMFSEQPTNTGLDGMLDNLILLTVEERQDIVNKYLTGMVSALNEVESKLTPLTKDVKCVELSGVKPVTSHETKCAVWARTFSTKLDEYIQNNPGQITDIANNVDALKLCIDRADVLVTGALGYNEKFKDEFRAQQWLNAQSLSRKMWQELRGVFKSTWADDGLTSILTDMDNTVELNIVPDVQPGDKTPATHAEERAALTNANVQAWAKASAEGPTNRNPKELAMLLACPQDVSEHAKGLLDKLASLKERYEMAASSIDTAQGSVPRTVMDESAVEVSKMALTELLDGNQFALEMIAANVKTMAGYAEALAIVHQRSSQIHQAAVKHFCEPTPEIQKDEE